MLIPHISSRGNRNWSRNSIKLYYYIAFYRKKVFLKNSQNPHENTCARVSCLIEWTLAQVFSVNFVRTSFLQNTPGQLFLIILSLMENVNISNEHFENKRFGNNGFNSEKADIYLIFLNTEKNNSNGSFLLSYIEDIVI